MLLTRNDKIIFDLIGFSLFLEMSFEKYKVNINRKKTVLSIFFSAGYYYGFFVIQLITLFILSMK